MLAYLITVTDLAPPSAEREVSTLRVIALTLDRALEAVLHARANMGRRDTFITAIDVGEL